MKSRVSIGIGDILSRLIEIKQISMYERKRMLIREKEKKTKRSRKEREYIRRNYVGFSMKSLNFDKRGR